MNGVVETSIPGLKEEHLCLIYLDSKILDSLQLLYLQCHDREHNTRVKTTTEVICYCKTQGTVASGEGKKKERGKPYIYKTVKENKV